MSNLQCRVFDAQDPVIKGDINQLILQYLQEEQLLTSATNLADELNLKNSELLTKRWRKSFIHPSSTAHLQLLISHSSFVHDVSLTELQYPNCVILYVVVNGMKPIVYWGNWYQKTMYDGSSIIWTVLNISNWSSHHSTSMHWYIWWTIWNLWKISQNHKPSTSSRNCAICCPVKASQIGDPTPFSSFSSSFSSYQLPYVTTNLQHLLSICHHNLLLITTS